jgi:hypothetical protein
MLQSNNAGYVTDRRFNGIINVLYVLFVRLPTATTAPAGVNQPNQRAPARHELIKHQGLVCFGCSPIKVLVN